MPVLHVCPAEQSESSRHFCPTAHRGQTAPPQSTSVSEPSFCCSPHWRARQRSEVALQALEAQSASTLHCLPTAQAGQVPPPQSTSVSLPSFWWSAHGLATQRSVSASQA